MTEPSRNLRGILDDGPIRIARAIQIVRGIARELAHTHLQGVVQGGVKPSNIIVLSSGAVKFIDYGAGPAVPLSPEQARGDAVDHRSDVFALGALFYEMLAHRPPFAGSTPKEVAHSLLHAAPPPPSGLNQLVPPALDAIVLSMLAKQPADRMPGIPVLLRELERLEAELGLVPAAPAVADEPAPDVPPGRREPTLNLDSSTDDALEHRKRIIDREVADHRAAAARAPAPWPPRSSRVETVTAVITVLVILGLGVGGFLYFTADPGKRDIAARRVQQASAATAATGPTAPPPVAEAPKEPAPVPAVDPIPKKPLAKAAVRTIAPPPVAKAAEEREERDAPAAAPAGSGLTIPPSIAEATPKPAPAPSVPEQPASLPAAPAKEPAQAKQVTAKVAKPQPAGKAQLVFAVSPGGEVYINDEHFGTTPQTTTFDLPPGMYRVEVRSGSRKPYLTYITVEAGDVRRIQHDFNARPSAPPG